MQDRMIGPSLSMFNLREKRLFLKKNFVKPVRPSVCVYQLSAHWMDFREIW